MYKHGREAKGAAVPLHCTGSSGDIVRVRHESLSSPHPERRYLPGCPDDTAPTPAPTGTEPVRVSGRECIETQHSTVPLGYSRFSLKTGNDVH